MATQKRIIQRKFERESEGNLFFKKRTTKIERMEDLFKRQEYRAVITRARPLLEKGIADAYLWALKACKELKNVATAERIVRIGLKQGKIRPEILLQLLGEVYLATDRIEQYHKTVLAIRELKRKREERLEAFTS